jgi:hypothetical protein
MYQPLRRAPRIFDKSVAVDITVPVDPLQRQLDVGPNGLDKGVISRALVVCGRQNDEEGGRVYRAVVPLERNLTEGG